MSRVSASLAGLTLATVLALPATAADVYPGGYKDAYVPAAVWTGFYAGVNGGYGWNANSPSIYAYADDGGVINTSPEKSFDKSGGFGGGQLGYNLQRDRLVFGIEADIQGGDITGSGSAFTSVAGGDVLASPHWQNTLDWFGTVRGRLGYAYDRALIYFTGGFAYGGTHGTATIVVDDTEGSGVGKHTWNLSATRTGYVLGGGVEYALTPAWSVKGEYQFIDFGGSNLYFGMHETAPDGGTNYGRGYVNNDQTYNTVRLGLNYHFFSGIEPLK